MELEKNRQTEIVEPYKLPDGWKWCKQSEVCKLIDGEKIADKEYPYLEVKYLRGNKEKKYVTSGKFISAGTKVILVDGENSGEVFTVPEDGFMGSTFKALSIQNVNEEYLQLFIETKKDLYRNNKKGSAIPHLNKDLFFNMPFPLPPINSQLSIVNSIETMFAKLDQAQEKAQAVLDSFETRKAAILHKAFTGQLRIDNEELTIDDWEEKKLEDVLIEKPRNGYSTTAVDYETPYKTMSLSATTSGYFRPEFYKYIEADISDDSFLWLKPGDILIQRANSLDKVGTSAIYTGGEHEFIYPDLMMKLQVKESVSNAFIAYQLKTEESLAYFRNNATGTAGNMPKINQKTVCNLPIKLPPLNYQLSIVNFLDTVLEKESRAKDAAQTVLDQIALLKKSILARAFRGEL